MSRKANRFASIITQPLNVYNFEIRIKSFVDEVDADILATVQSTTFPSEQNQETTLYHQGEAVTYAVKPKVGGDWSITLPEGDKGQVRQELDRLKDAMYDQVTGVFTPQPWYDIEVFQKDLQENIVFSVVLHGCWIKGRGDQNLTAGEPTTNWSNVYTFHYGWLQDKLKPNLAGTPNPVGA